MIPLLLEQHYRNQHAPSSLLLGFHGTIGVGKTLVSKLVADHLYERGTKSKFVRTFNYHIAKDPQYGVEYFDIVFYLTLMTYLTQNTQNSSITEGPRDAVYELKS